MNNRLLYNPSLSSRLLFLLILLVPGLLLMACDPKYNWREVHDDKGGFEILLPNKPVTASRTVNLAVENVSMTMTASEVDGVTFAVGYAHLSNTKLTTAALQSMRATLVTNINGRPNATQTVAVASADDLEAQGTPTGKSEPWLLLGHFASQGNRVYQVIVLGKVQAVSREEARTFLSSFKLH